MIGPAGFMAGPKTEDGAPRARWDVSSFNRRGMAHWWVDIPLNPRYVRSHCGQVEDKRNLQGLAHELRRCSVCEKAMRSNVDVTGPRPEAEGSGSQKC